MTVRTWVYSQLTTNAPARLTELVGDRVFAKRSMRSSVETTPYLVYKLGLSANAMFAEDTLITRQYLQVWVHDHETPETADYAVIDEIVDLVIGQFHQTSSPADGVIRSELVETSQDFNDDTLSTIFRYPRFVMQVKN